mmetsp:Transcript_33525/g.73357  ORF Transcript_33525/g.73357 Transcript_33525/m.73357 type:complete len:200 (+) Transcript_33525:910-1509(+)
MAVCTAWKPPLLQPIPSVVITWRPSSAQTRRRQALMLTVTTDPSRPLEDTATVQAPQPPSPQPTLVPVRPFARSQCTNRREGDGFTSTWALPFSQKWISLLQGTSGRTSGTSSMWSTSSQSGSASSRCTDMCLTPDSSASRSSLSVLTVSTSPSWSEYVTCLTPATAKAFCSSLSVAPLGREMRRSSEEPARRRLIFSC